MNEITRIHLGRQSFTISVDAHKALQAYLAAIKHQVGDRSAEVSKEVELRMAELLTERGITGKKVVLLEDINFLKEQLGAPKDFKDEDEEHESPTEKSEREEAAPKRLYRNTERGMFAGVAAGLATYFGVDAVVVRLAFVLAVLLGGWGIALYIIMWLIVPEAKTQSDKLQMLGKAVTVSSLKDIVTRADVPGVARRANHAFARIIQTFFKILLAICGAAFVTLGMALLFWIVVGSVYALIPGIEVNGELIFPIGTSEIFLLLCGAVVVIILALFFLLIGLSMIRRKWQVSSWIVATMLGIFLLAGAVGVVITADSGDRIYNRIESIRRTQTRPLPAFKTVNINGTDTYVTYRPADNYAVELKYLGKPDTKLLTTEVKDSLLTVDSTTFEDKTSCHWFCIYTGRKIEVIIYAPSLDYVKIEGDDVRFANDKPLNQDEMTIEVARDASSAYLSYMYPESVQVRDMSYERTRVVHLSGIRSAISTNETIDIYEDVTIAIDRTNALQFETDAACTQVGELVHLRGDAAQVTLNGQLVGSQKELAARHDIDGSNVYNCVTSSMY